MIEYGHSLQLINPLSKVCYYKVVLELKSANISAALHLSFISSTWRAERTVSQQQVCLGQPRYQQDSDCPALFGVTQAAVKKSMAC